MKQKLIKLNESHYIVVDDSDIKEGDWVIDKHKSIYQQLSDKVFEKFTGAKKITYSTQPLNKQFNDWFDVKIIPLSEVEEAIYGYSVEKLFKGSWMSRYSNFDSDIGKSFELGFNTCKELVKDKLFTVEDMEKALNKLSIAYKNGYSRDFDIDFQEADSIIQSLLPPTEWDVEFVNGKLKLIK